MIRRAIKRIVAIWHRYQGDTDWHFDPMKSIKEPTARRWHDGVWESRPATEEEKQAFLVWWEIK